MKRLILASILALGFLIITSCGKDSCEKNNEGTVIIHNNSTKGKLWLALDKSYGPGLSSADIEISAGETFEIKLPAGIHTFEGVFTYALGSNGTQIKGTDDKEVLLMQCDETNIYYDL